MDINSIAMRLHSGLRQLFQVVKFNYPIMSALPSNWIKNNVSHLSFFYHLYVRLSSTYAYLPDEDGNEDEDDVNADCVLRWWEMFEEVTFIEL